MNNLVELIKNLPPLLKEQVIGTTTEIIREEERLKLMNEINLSASIVISDVTENIIISHKTGKNWSRPEYTKNIDNDLYQTFVDISQTFVEKHIEKLCFDNSPERQRRRLYYSEEFDDSDSDFDDYS